MAGWIKMPLGMEEELGPGDFVLEGDPALPFPKKGAEPPPQFSAHVHCGQTAGCINYATRYGGRLQPRRVCVRWGPIPLPKKGAESPPQFKG